MSGPTLVVLAAGLGSRFGGLKQFFELGPAGETLADYTLFDAARAGFARALLVVGERNARACRARYAPRWKGRLAVETVVQRLDDLPGGRRPPAGRRKPWGTAHAVWCARERLDGPFAVVNADDFYGRAAFVAARRFLARKSDEAALISYPVGETLSPTGGVARAVCRVGSDGRLRAIRECRDVRRRADGIVAVDAGELRLPADAQISMNFWCLPPGAPRAFEASLARLSGSDDEAAIPEAVGAAIASGALSARALPEGRGWIGVTYREDAPAATSALKALASAGDYPSPVWARKPRSLRAISA